MRRHLPVTAWRSRSFGVSTQGRLDRKVVESYEDYRFNSSREILTGSWLAFRRSRSCSIHETFVVTSRMAHANSAVEGVAGA